MIDLTPHDRILKGCVALTFAARASYSGPHCSRRLTHLTEQGWHASNHGWSKYGSGGLEWDRNQDRSIHGIEKGVGDLRRTRAGLIPRYIFVNCIFIEFLSVKSTEPWDNWGTGANSATDCR